MEPTVIRGDPLLGAGLSARLPLLVQSGAFGRPPYPGSPSIVVRRRVGEYCPVCSAIPPAQSGQNPGGENLDVETLRLTYAEVIKQIDLLAETRGKTYGEFAALPPAAGAILAVFVAFRPEDLPGVFPYLYGG